MTIWSRFRHPTTKQRCKFLHTDNAIGDSNYLSFFPVVTEYKGLTKYPTIRGVTGIKVKIK